MSIEGMWCFISGEVGGPVMESGGVVVLESQHIFGGDSAMAYAGKYEVDSGTIRGEVESWKYNPSQEGYDVFGQEAGPVRQTTFEATLNEAGFLVGHLERDGLRLPLVLQKLRDLP